MQARSGPPGEFPPLSITVRLSPGEGTTQTPFSLRVQAHDGDGWVRISSVNWGDGGEYRQIVPVASCGQPAPPPVRYQPTPSAVDERLGHAWRLPGAYRVRVFIDSGRPTCSPHSRASAESQSAVLFVSVAQEGRITSNGPGRPVIHGVTLVASTRSSRTGEVIFNAHDTDGAIRHFSVDWGDGSPPDRRTISWPPCDDGGGKRYPGGQAEDGSAGDAHHRYAKAGRYRVVLTVISSGCDDKDMQQLTAGGSVRVVD